MVVNHNLWFPSLKQPLPRSRIFRIGFDKIAVEVIIARIGPKSVGIWPVLIDARHASIEATVHVINGYDAQQHVGGQGFLFQKFAGPHHAGIYALWLAWVNAIIDQKYHFVGLWLKDFIGRKYQQMQRLANVGSAHLQQRGLVVFFVQCPIKRHYFGIRGRFLAFRFFVGSNLGKNRRG